MQAHTRFDLQRRQREVVVEREARRIGHGVEEQEEPVAAVDLQAVMPLQQLPRAAVMLGPPGRSGVVAHTLHQLRAVDQVGEEKGAHGLVGTACVTAGPC